MHSENDIFTPSKEKTTEILAVGSSSDEPQVKRTVRDSVFTHLFQDKRYLLQLYRAMHPEDGSVTEEDLVNITIDNVLVDGQYNDLGFLVGDRMMILIEAQSTWSVNVVVRGFLYLAETLRKYFAQHKSNLYGSKKVCLPRMELYVIYTGDRRKRPDELSLTDEFFGGEKCAVEATVKMIYGSVASGEDGEEDIIGQYVNF
ncbi:MAG: hypothetical protein LUE87_10665 [Lachnospiraceae bacterium]|nr:hypothetical protein [Lachnospiraceae bacterium]